jgi:hypothetical protein
MAGASDMRRLLAGQNNRAPHTAKRFLYEGALIKSFLMHPGMKEQQ